MKKISKLSIITLISLSTISVLSCGSKDSYTALSDDDTDLIDYKINRFKPLDYNNVFNKKNGENQPIFYGGINYTAYTQGVSFIFNILRGLGWNWEDAEKIRKLYDDTFDFNSINIMKTKSGFENHKASVFEKEFENYFNSKGDYYNYKSLGDFIETITKKNLVIPNLYNQIKSLLYIDKGLNKDELLKIDASTKVEISLPGFKNLTKTKEKLKMIAKKLNNKDIMEKIFQGKKYAYSWSGEYLSKLGFQIQENKIIFWHISDALPKIIKNVDLIRKFNNDLQKNIRNHPLSKAEQKNLNQIPIDPFGSVGSMSSRFFYTNLNLKNTGKNDKVEDYFGNLNVNSKGNGKFIWNDKDKNKRTQNISSFSSFIDGKNPGSIILKMFEGKNLKYLTKINYPLKTFYTKNRIQTFYKLKNGKKINDIVRLIYIYIKFLKEQINKQQINDEKSRDIMSWILGVGSPVVKSFFEFIKNNEITENDIRKQFDEYNNGSHYMLAVEIFLRGMINVPEKFNSNHKIPLAVDIFLKINGQKRKSKEIVGMTNVNNLVAMIFMMYTSNRKYFPSDKSFNKDDKSKSLVGKIFHFNPQTQNFDYPYKFKSYEYLDYFIKDFTHLKKTGEEISHHVDI